MKRTPLTRKTPLARVGKKKLAQGSPRWNGAMGPSVKPRKRLRAKSKRNSNRHINRVFRNLYMVSNPLCEMLPLFPQYLGQASIPSPIEWKGSSLNFASLEWTGKTPSTDPHHILWGQARRHDIRANLLAICREAHDFCHKFKVDGMVLALTAKARKGELDWAELDRISGKNIRGWLSTKRPVFEFVVPLWAALVKGVE